MGFRTSFLDAFGVSILIARSRGGYHKGAVASMETADANTRVRNTYEGVGG